MKTLFIGGVHDIMVFKNISPKLLFSIQQAPIRRRFYIFSAVLILSIFISGAVVFNILVDKDARRHQAGELTLVFEAERLKADNIVSGDSELITRIAQSPLIREYFENPENREIAALALNELKNYRQMMSGNNIFWVMDADKKYYNNGVYTHLIDLSLPENSWYNITLRVGEGYNVSTSNSQDMLYTTLRIGAPVLNKAGKPCAVIGTGISLTFLANEISGVLDDKAKFYFFNEAGEITVAHNQMPMARKLLLEMEQKEAGNDLIHGAQSLEADNMKALEIEGYSGVAAVGKVPALGWYAAAVQPFFGVSAFRTPAAALFAALMLVVAIAVVSLNLFIAIIMEPLTHMAKAMELIAVDFDNKRYMDEIGALGVFLDMAMTDSLTGLYNRRFMEDRMKRIIKSLSRINGKLSVLMIDIDYFKLYNDSYGHGAGDKCLKAVAGILRKTLQREDDFAVRYGGEEFTVVLPNTDENGARLIAEKLLDAIGSRAIPHKKSKAADHLTISIGGVTATAVYTQTGSEYIETADKALYASKVSGRNRYTSEVLPIDYNQLFTTHVDVLKTRGDQESRQ